MDTNTYLANLLSWEVKYPKACSIGLFSRLFFLSKFGVSCPFNSIIPTIFPLICITPSAFLESTMFFRSLSKLKLFGFVESNVYPKQFSNTS